MHECGSSVLCCVRMLLNMFELLAVQCMSIKEKRLCGMCCLKLIVWYRPLLFAIACETQFASGNLVVTQCHDAWTPSEFTGYLCA